MKIPHLSNSLLSFLRVLDDEKANVKQITAIQVNHLSKLDTYSVVEEILVELLSCQGTVIWEKYSDDQEKYVLTGTF